MRETDVNFDSWRAGTEMTFCTGNEDESRWKAVARRASYRIATRILAGALALFGASACLTNDVVSEKPTDDLPAAHKILPRHRHMLEEVGWLEFVSANVDAIGYYDAWAFQTPKGAVGLAFYENNKRIAHIATAGHSDEDIVAWLVHEAGHLSGVAQVGELYGEDIARGVEKQFRRDRSEMVPR